MYAAAAAIVESGLEAEDSPPLTLEAAAPQVIEAELMLPLQATSPTASSPKVAESPDPGRGVTESASVVPLPPAAGTVGEASKSVAVLPEAAGSSSVSAVAETSVGVKHRLLA